MTSGRTFNTDGEVVRTSVKLTRDEFAQVANGSYPLGQAPRSGEPVTIVDKRGSRTAGTVVEVQDDGTIVAQEYPDAPQFLADHEGSVVAGAAIARRMPEVVDPDAPMGDQIAATVRNRTAEQLADHDRVVQNEIAKGFWQGEVVTAAQAEQRAVNTALQAALSQTLGEIAVKR